MLWSISRATEQLSGLLRLWLHCCGMNRPAWLFAQVMSFRPSNQVSGKGSLGFWSTAQDSVFEKKKKKALKHWLCGDRSQQSTLSSKSSDYLILDSAAQRSGNSWGGSERFSLSLRENIWQGQKRMASQPAHLPIHHFCLPAVPLSFSGQAAYCPKVPAAPPTTHQSLSFSFMKLPFPG